MKIIISPAKRMKEDLDGMPVSGMPSFPEKTGRLLEYLKDLSQGELKALLKCNESIASENYQRFQKMNGLTPRTPAIFAYQGIQYQYMVPKAFTEREFDYIQKNLRILSGFYGLLRPFDGIYPYRLEMQARPSFCSSLYEFWGEDLGAELSRNNDTVVDLASEEYSRAARKGATPELRWIKVQFGEVYEGRFLEKGTQCKMARGAMVRWMAEHLIENPDDIRGFDQLDYQFDSNRSGMNDFVFCKG